MILLHFMTFIIKLFCTIVGILFFFFNIWSSLYYTMKSQKSTKPMKVGAFQETKMFANIFNDILVLMSKEKTKTSRFCTEAHCSWIKYILKYWETISHLIFGPDSIIFICKREYKFPKLYSLSRFLRKKILLIHSDCEEQK